MLHLAEVIDIFIEKCTKSTRAKFNTRKAHGGDIRCSYPGCIKSARDKSDRCKAHGGGKRCIEKGCTKSAINKTNKCVSHGGGNRCPNCIDCIDSRGGFLKYYNYCATYINIFFRSAIKENKYKVKRNKSKKCNNRKK